MTADHDIDYDALAQEAMRGVVRAVLSRIQKSGLPGNHHFYIAFDTRHPGVVLSKRLKSKYAEEMTIVLQHVFWELIVSDARFEVKLRFDGIPERLVVPFAAIKIFFDPSVPYALQFDEAGATREAGGGIVGISDHTSIAGQITGVPGLARAPQRPSVGERKRPTRRSRSDREEDGAPAAEEITQDSASRRAEPRPHAALVPLPSSPEDEPSGGAAPTQDNVISLDRFRKKP